MNAAAMQARANILNGPDTPGRRLLLRQLEEETRRNRERLAIREVKPLPTKPKLVLDGEPIRADFEHDPELQGGEGIESLGSPIPR